MPVRLVDRFPAMSPDALVAARGAGEIFASALHARTCRGCFGRRHQVAVTGLYFGGGFGVGKTHLLAAIWHAAPQPKACATFVELTQLVGELGFAQAVARLSCMTVLEIDSVTAVHLLDVTPAADQSAGLRVPVFADRLYDRRLSVVTSGSRLDEIFDADMLCGGYRKKYGRAVSRLVAPSRLSVSDGR